MVEVDHYRIGRPGARYSTSVMKAAEQEIMDIALSGRGRSLPVTNLSKEQWSEFKSLYRERRTSAGQTIQLNDHQLLLAFMAVSGRDQWMMVRGIAGAGKSSSFGLVAELVQQFSASGYEICGVAATTAATNNLTEMGVHSFTLASLNCAGDVDPLAPARLYVLDEASLAGVMSVLPFARRVRAQDRVVVVYDPRQHQSIEAGRIADQMEAAGVQTIKLEKIVRQSQSPVLLAVITSIAESFQRGKNDLMHKALHSLDQDLGAIEEASHKQKRIDRLADFYEVDPPRTLVVAPDNETLVQLGAACRERLPAAVLDRQTEAELTILTGVKTMRKADLKRAARYEMGDVICWGKASTLGGRGHVECREYTEVLAIDAIQNRLTVRTAAGDVTYTASAAQGEVYRTAKRRFAVGETIRLTKPWGPPGNKVANRAVGRIVELNEQGQRKLQFGEKTYHWDIRSNPHLDWGYATTSYRSQSVTFDRVGVHIDTGNRGYAASSIRCWATLPLAAPLRNY